VGLPLKVTEVLSKLDPDDPALQLMIELTGRMGFRLREATHLRAEDVTFHRDGSAFIAVASGIDCSCRDCRGTRLTKAGSARLVPIPMDLQGRVRMFLEVRRARFGAAGTLFPVWRAKPRQRTKPGQLRVARTVSDAFLTAAAAAGLETGRETGVVFHDLRATAKTHLLLAGANPTAVDVALGHALPGMSAIYVQFVKHPALLYKGVYPTWEPTLTVVKGQKTA
jgi:integrase